MVLDAEVRRAGARREILQVCWQLAAEHGLTGFSLRQVATAIGMRAPSLYSYYPAKSAMYDAMFRSAAESFDQTMAALPQRRDARRALRASARAYLGFCVDDPVRYQLLFQRAVPGFEPSPEAFAPAIATYERMRASFAGMGVTKQQHLDLWTAILAGMAAQQLANDPGGDRWVRLANEATDMFLAHIHIDGGRS